MKATTLINRYNTESYKLLSLLHEFDKLLGCIKLPTQKRGRPPKLKPETYLLILLSKEYLGHSLRVAEHVDADLISRRRVPKSTLNYWEQKPGIRKAIKTIFSLLSEKLEKLIGYEISVLDSTKLTSWLKELVEMHALLRYKSGVLYLASYCFTSSQSLATEKIREGSDFLLADRWYDDKKVLYNVVERGYKPLIRPRGYGARGYGAKLRDDIWRDFRLRRLYKLRGVGEGFFGALALWFGQRLTAKKLEVVKLRLAMRCLLYNLRIWIRCSRLGNEIFEVRILVNYWTLPSNSELT